MSASQYLYKRFEFPWNGKTVEVRRITDGLRPEAVVREVNQDNELSPGEYNLRLEFLLQRARAVRHV
ncbi:hypothetical protein GCM10007320_08930 [Pseudorhodoferax aquiterrae]|uniref:Uncharacterized protein n=1 Tax=Pseudorhodoferax aquiterrae TaxID=747304 RepID=A0ABQ3FX82_9BURK|nr:hypothetical protein [Pseudorhodoferax aquiterrae]GHC72804.1 hypothetical protein GCM10007320_08930 [Pseudorhodoferax aquiterrae]